MIEAYAFLAAFTVQIVAMSVLNPLWFIRRARMQATSVPAERVAQLYPGVDVNLSVERFATRYRAVNTGVAVLGFLLLGWLFTHVRRPDWDDGPVEALVSVYFVVQVLPMCVAAWLAVRSYRKALERSLPEGKRTATLQRRGLFDFVSPFVVALAVLLYFLFAAFVLYIEQHPFPGFAGPLVNISCLTLLYALNAFAVYTMLYGRTRSPFETHAGRLHTISLTVKGCVYSSILAVVFLSLNFTLVLLDLQRWEPVAQSIFFVTATLLCFKGLTAPPRQSGAAGLGPDERLIHGA